MTGAIARRPILLLVLLVLAGVGWSSSAAAQGWVQCVARSSSSGALYVGEPVDGGDRAKAAQYRAEFIKAGRAAGVAEAELSPQTAFCFMASSQADLARMLADLGKPCPSCSAPYRATPVAWNLRDILPAEIAAAAHVTTLVMSEPPAPAPVLTPVSAPAGAEPPPPAPPPEPPRPLASVRWRALLCGEQVRLSYAFEAPADSPVESAPFQGAVLAGSGIEQAFDDTLAKSANAAPGCASPKFVPVADLARFSKDLPPRGEARLAALRQRLEDVALRLAPPPAPPPPPVVAEVAPAPVAASAKGKAVAAAKPPLTTAAAAPVQVAAKPPPKPTPVAAAAPIVQATATVRSQPPVATLAAPTPPSDDAQARASAQLNAEVAKRNAEVDARNAAASADYEKRMAAYKAAQDSYASAQASYERNAKAHEAQVNQAAQARVEWEAKVKACNAGDRAACAP